MAAEREVDRWDRFGRYSRADIEKARRSTPQRRRKMRIINGSAFLLLWLTSAALDFVARGDAWGSELLVSMAIPNGLLSVGMVYFAVQGLRAWSSKLSEEEARELADLAEEQERKDRAVGRWLWRGGERPPQLK